MKTAEARLHELLQVSPDYSFTLRLNGAIAGFVFSRPFSWHDGTRIWIEEIVVEEQHRGKGLGKLLIRTLLEKCRREKIVGVSLVSKENSSAFTIYEKMGMRRSDWVHLEIDLEELV
jgi:GNAT superfamily N-acetyltransferase